MILYVLRHAIAVQRGTPGYERDDERPLTGKGERKMRKIARAMKGLKLEFDHILSSPLVRARQTAEVLAEVFKAHKKLKFVGALAPEGNPEHLIVEIRDIGGDAGQIMLVGHEPYLGELVSVLLSGHKDIIVTLRKGGLCKLTVEKLTYGKCATLEWLITPRQLIRLR